MPPYLFQANPDTYGKARRQTHPTLVLSQRISLAVSLCRTDATWIRGHAFLLKLSDRLGVGIVSLARLGVVVFQQISKPV